MPTRTAASSSRKALARDGRPAGSPRTASRADRGSRREQVLAVAVDMFHERGFADTSVEEVASAVGLLKGSLYYYIDSKQDLLLRIVAEVQEQLDALLAEATADASLPPLQRLERLVRAQVEYTARNLRPVAVYHHERRRLAGEGLAELQRRRRAQERAVIRLLEEAKAAGDVDAGLDARAAAEAVAALIAWPYTWYRPGSLSPEALADATASFLLGGVRGVPGRRAAVPRAARRAAARAPRRARAARASAARGARARAPAARGARAPAARAPRARASAARAPAARAAARARAGRRARPAGRAASGPRRRR